MRILLAFLVLALASACADDPSGVERDPSSGDDTGDDYDPPDDSAYVDVDVIVE